MTLRKKIGYWLVPDGVKQLARQARRIGKSPVEAEATVRAAALCQENVQFRGRHQGQRCFILATGPSVKKQDLSVLAGELCIGVSFFFLHPEANRIKPKYHVIAANHAPFDFDLPRRYFTGLTGTYLHECEVFYGYFPYKYSCLDFIRENSPTWPRPVRILNYTGLGNLDENNIQDDAPWDISGRPFATRTVIYGAIQLAAYLGCTEIILVGCDHDYLSDVTRQDNHFYKEKSGNPQDAKHLEGFTTERWFQEYHARWRDYRLMKTHLAARGVKIINATAGGMLDVFERRSLAEILAKSPASVCPP